MPGAQKRRYLKERPVASDASQAPESASAAPPAPATTPPALGSSPEDGSPKDSSDGSPGSSPKSDRRPTRYDGNRDTPSRSGSLGPQDRVPQVSPATGGTVPGRAYGNLDLGGKGRLLVNGEDYRLPSRPAQANKTGTAINVKLNTFNVVKTPTKNVYQWDVLVGNGAERPVVIKKTWNSKKVNDALGPGWVFDGNKLAWSLSNPKVGSASEARIEVDMDVVNGREPRAGKTDIKRIVLKKTKTIDFTTLQAYLAGQTDFNVDCLEAMNFLDHLMRETPSKRYVQIRQSFFSRSDKRFELGAGLEAFKGVYASMRMGVLPTGAATLTVNVDVNNTAFWKETTLIQLAVEVAMGGRREADPRALANTLAAGKQPHNSFPQLAKLKRLLCYTTHVKSQSKEEQRRRPMKISRFINATARQQMLKDVQIEKDGPKQNLSLFNYFERKYNTRLQYPDLPLVQMDKKFNGNPIILPMELLIVAGDQRYFGRLNDRQTTEMLKFAATRPKERWQGVENGLRLLNWGQDTYLANYGLNISQQPSSVSARLLPPPLVGFGTGSAGGPGKPGTSGRWDLKGKKFYRGSRLDYWGVACLDINVNEGQIQQWMRSFRQTLNGHGVVVSNDPLIYKPDGDIGDWVTKFWNATGNKFQKRPQLLMFIVPNKDKTTYERLKRNCECRPNIGTVSQVIQSKAVLSGYNPQYGSNVSMKVNAKLGGVTAKALGQVPSKASHVPAGSMFLGGDVTHGSMAPGESPASLAALSMSADMEFIKYWAACKTNGYRQEMIQRDNIKSMIDRMARQWMKAQNGKLPSHVFYVRDGVSEGQYAQVLKYELADIAATFSDINGNEAAKIKYVCIIGTKRHHIRFFPERGDNNGNALPGTLVEHGVTQPNEFDFYLCAHNAIKGTARPVHYTVIRNDSTMNPSEMQNMLYEASYQFVRSTTPVSLFPASYYAHLAAARGRCHETAQAQAASSGDNVTVTGSGTGTEDPETFPLMPIGAPGQNNVEPNMWYV